MPQVLKILFSGQKPEELDSNSHFCRIGRNKDNCLVIYDENDSERFSRVSRQHGFFSNVIGKGFFYEDNSTYGSYVKIGDSKKFIKRDWIEIRSDGSINLGSGDGPEITFWFEDRDSVAKDNSFVNNEKCSQSAFMDFKKKLRQKGADPILFWSAAIMAEDLYYFDDAVRFLENYLCFFPEEKQAEFRLAKIYENLGDLNSASLIYKSILEKNPNNTVAIGAMDRLYRHHPEIVNQDDFLRQTSSFIIPTDDFEALVPPFVIRGAVEAHGRRLTDIGKFFRKSLDYLSTNLSHDFTLPGRINVCLNASNTSRIEARTNNEAISICFHQKRLNSLGMLEMLIFHEFAHFFLGTLTGWNLTVPWWFHEGFAQVMSQKLEIEKINLLLSIYEKQKDISLRHFEKEPASGYRTRIGYTLSHASMAFIVNNYGISWIDKLIKGLKAYDCVYLSFENVFGLNFSDFEEKVRLWIMEKYKQILKDDIYHTSYRHSNNL